MYSTFGAINHGSTLGGNFTTQTPFNGLNTLGGNFPTQIPFHGFNTLGGNFTNQIPINGFNTVPYGMNTIPFNPFQTWNQIPVPCQPNLGFWNGMNTMPTMNPSFVPSTYGTNLNHPYVNCMPNTTFGTTPVHYGLWNNSTIGNNPGVCF